MTTVRRTVVVGASVAGVRTAQALRAEGHDGEILVIGAEPHVPYDRPPLSKQFLLGRATPDRFALVPDPPPFELRLSCTATAWSPSARTVHLRGTESVEYDDLVIATGARAADSPWGLPRRVHTLRSLSDAEALRSDLARAGSVVVIGAGVVGAEVASAATEMGLGVTLVDTAPGPLARLLTPEVSAWLAGYHAARGVRARYGVLVTGIESTDSECTVSLADGTRVVADAAVVAIGAALNVEWLSDSGLETSRGVRCDEYGRVRGADGVFAVGDVSRWWDPSRREHRRTEHWSAAVDQAAVVAHNLLRPTELRTADPLDYMWSDQFGAKLQVLGRVSGDTAVSHCVADGRWYAVFGHPGQAASGVALFNWPRGLGIARRGLAAGNESVALSRDLGTSF